MVLLKPAPKGSLTEILIKEIETMHKNYSLYPLEHQLPKNSLPIKVSTIWNRLPHYVANINIFKTSLTHWESNRPPYRRKRSRCRRKQPLLKSCSGMKPWNWAVRQGWTSSATNLKYYRMTSSARSRHTYRANVSRPILPVAEGLWATNLNTSLSLTKLWSIDQDMFGDMSLSWSTKYFGS